MLSGFASSFGSRAVENKIFLSKIIQFFHNKNMVFLDLTESSRSYTQQVSREYDVMSRQSKIYQKSNPLDIFYNRKIITSSRFGESLMVFPYSINLLQQITVFLN